MNCPDCSREKGLSGCLAGFGDEHVAACLLIALARAREEVAKERAARWELEKERDEARAALSAIMAHYDTSNRCTVGTGIHADAGPTISELAAARAALEGK